MVVRGSWSGSANFIKLVNGPIFINYSLALSQYYRRRSTGRSLPESYGPRQMLGDGRVASTILRLPGVKMGSYERNRRSLRDWRARIEFPSTRQDSAYGDDVSNVLSAEH